MTKTQGPWQLTCFPDEKETAEHRMLVDLGRNDIGRISETASVKSPSIWKWSSSAMLCI